MKLSVSEKIFFHTCAKEVLSCDPVWQMKGFLQHGNTSCLSHSIAVSYVSFALCRRLRLHCDDKSLIRGALLHDFFLYDWHQKTGRYRWHGFSHPKIALSNAQRYFTLNDIEQDIIVKHMWPLTIIPPKCKESVIVTLADKYCSAAETLKQTDRILNIGLIQWLKGHKCKRNDYNWSKPQNLKEELLMLSFGESLKNILLAGIGAVATTSEKSKEIVEELVKKGELTVEQGKVLNEELKHKVGEKIKDSAAMNAIKNVTGTSAEAIVNNLDKLSPEEIAKIKEKLAEMETADISKDASDTKDASDKKEDE